MGRTYSECEKEVLLAMAASTSIASPAKTVAAMKEARQAKEISSDGLPWSQTPLTAMMGTFAPSRAAQLIDSSPRRLLHAAIKGGHDLRRLIEMLLRGARGDLAGASSNVRFSGLVGSALKGSDTVRPINLESHTDLSLFVDEAPVAQILRVFLDKESHTARKARPPPPDLPSKRRKQLSGKEQEGLGPEADPEDLFKPFHRGADGRLREWASASYRATARRSLGRTRGFRSDGG